MKHIARAIVALLAFSICSHAVDVGQPAPAFSAPDSEGQQVSLEPFKGKWVVLYFYPKADTPGCTKQSCSLRDGHAEITNAGAVVLGVSLDAQQAQADFKEKYQLPFTLISDAQKEVAKAYGVLPPGGLVAQRKTFIIDPAGKIAYIFERVDVGSHQGEVLAVLKQLQSNP